MELVDIIDIIINEPIYLTIAVFLLLIIVYSILKKIFKLMIIALSCLIIYISYLVYTGQNLPGNVEIDPIKEKIENTIQEAKGTLDKIIDNKSE